MSCTIADVAMSVANDGTSVPQAAAQIVISPTQLPVFESVAGAMREITAPTRTATTDATGNWSFAMPWPSESSPTTVRWSIKTPDGYSLCGQIPEGIAGPLTLFDLQNTYGWKRVNGTAQTFLTVQGASGTASGSVLPTPDVTQRGRVFTLFGAPGTPDVAYVCMKLSDDSYEWFEIGAAP